LLVVTSKEPDSGKTTLVGLINFLVPRGLLVVEISAAAVYRFIEKLNPTFTVDEGDTIFEDNEVLRSVFNSGWTRGSGVPRVNPDTLEPEIFPTFAPKVIGIKGLNLPPTTLSRSIILELKRKLPKEVIEADFDHIDDNELRMLRGQLSRWASDNLESLRHA